MNSNRTFGHFDDARREYVITDAATPWPWINYLGNEDFFSLISGTAGGYSFCRDAKFRRITRYRYNGVPMDAGGRYFYIKDGDTVWNPGWKPCRTPLDSYECRHGMSYTRITGSKDGVEASVLFFVPLKAFVEVQQLTLTNHTTEEKRLKVFSLEEWCLWNAATDMENFQRNFSTGEVEVELNAPLTDGRTGAAIYHKTEYKERRNHYAWYSVNSPVQGFDTDRETFIGLYNGFDAPQCVTAGQPQNSVAHGWSPIASHYLEVTLAPGETRDFIFLLGYAEMEQDEKFSATELERKRRGELLSSQDSDVTLINKEKAHALMARFDSVAKVQQAFAELGAYWDELLGRFSAKTDDERVDRMVNIWNQYQCMITFNFSRSTSFFESGIGRGMGFRDSNQDLVGFVHQIPSRARERIIDIASVQWADGSTYHQYQPLTKRGNNDIGSGFNDDPLWLVAAVYAYISETGDWDILSVPTPFDNEKGSEQPLMEHLRRSVNFTAGHRGPHGLPLIGRADWNDCLNLNCFSEEPGESFQTYGPSEGPVAESVFIGGMFVLYGKQYAELCRAQGLDGEAETVLAAVRDVENAVKTAGWDGEWFVRAYDAFGAPVGSSACDEGKIFIEPQGMCVMAGIGKDDGKAESALNSVRKHLLGKYGVELLAPCYTVYHKELGEISSYPPGYKENGSVFCHNNPWISIAETVIGRGNNAFDVYRRTCPVYQEESSEIRRVEPYVYAQTVAGRASFDEGAARNSWLTGTAAWTFVNISQYILGIRPTPEGLSVIPCLPEELTEYTVRRRFRGATYVIRVRKTGSRSMTVDGAKADGCVIIPAEGKTEYQVEVTV